ncbi:YbjQ family protein [Candidatus Dojkabacteria bacterium]|jgi:hypothetical protein|nr:YbjQ family protein [Candidatus Dojkabacteria bacterium]
MARKKNIQRDFHITRIVTRDVLTDSFQSIRNMLGMRLRGYEKRLNETVEVMIEEMNLVYKNIEWYRISINPLTSGSIMIIIYGQGAQRYE